MDMFFLNVGGMYYVTTRQTLLESNSFFTGLASATEGNEAFIDRDPAYFRYILNWIRGVKVLPDDEYVLKELLWEADFYCITDMKEALQRHKSYSALKCLSEVASELRRK